MKIRQIDEGTSLSSSQPPDEGGAADSRRARTQPADDLWIPDGLDVSLVTNGVLAALDGDLYGNVPRPAILPEYRDLPGAVASIDMGALETSPGSNNWAIGRALTGGPAIMVDDPHRQVTNRRTATCCTCTRARLERRRGDRGAAPRRDSRAQRPRHLGTHRYRDGLRRRLCRTGAPANPNEVRRNGAWEPLRTITEEILVKGAPAVRVELKFSRHGPVFHEDRQRHVRSPCGRSCRSAAPQSMSAACGSTRPRQRAIA